MKTLRDKYRLLNCSYHNIFVIIPNEQYDEQVESVRALNKCNNLTCGIFKFVPIKKVQRNSTTLQPMIADHIGDNNLFVRLRGGAQKYFRYGYGLVDLTADANTIEEVIVEFVKDILNDIIKLLDAKLTELAKSPKDNKDKIELAQQKKEEYNSYYSQVGAERGVYKKVLSATVSKNVQISIKNIQTIHYRRPTTRYGIEISVNDAKVPMYIGDTTQTILYIAALIRFNMGKPLYLHELYINSCGLHSIYKRGRTYEWLALIYKEIFGQTGVFEEWAYPIRGEDNEPRLRSGHDFNQAKSGIFNKLKAILGDHLAFAVDRCCLSIAKDENKDTYYTFHCSPEDIILDEKAQKLSILFKKLYSLRY